MRWRGEGGARTGRMPRLDASISAETAQGACFPLDRRQARKKVITMREDLRLGGHKKVNRCKNLFWPRLKPKFKGVRQ